MTTNIILADCENKQDTHFTDSTNAERFAAQHGLDVRYCHPWGKWLVWDGTRWRPDDTGEVYRLAKGTVRSMYADASKAMDENKRSDIVKHAKASESAARRKAMLSLAKSEEPIPITPERLDTDPWLLNVKNGTIDLRSGKLRMHCRDDLITKLAPVEYDDHAQAPTWEVFLGRIFNNNTNVIRFMQRLLGYILTGDVSEQVLTIFHGTGANGKSTLVEAVMEMLGPDYSAKAPRDLLVAKRSGHPTELTVLYGRRLVVTTETEDGCRLAESSVKELTGSDTVTARRMREDYWQFRPSHKLVMSTNHRPVVLGTDEAIWRRLLLVPFSVTIPPKERDRDLLAKLHKELPGILAWCVRGCLLWQDGGLKPPPEVQHATDGYRAEQDLLGGFLAERCVVEPGAKASASDLLEAYQTWSGDKSMTMRRLGLALNEKGFIKKEANGRVYRVGLGLLTSQA